MWSIISLHKTSQKLHLQNVNVQFTPPDRTRQNCRVASSWAVWIVQSTVNWTKISLAVDSSYVQASSCSIRWTCVLLFLVSFAVSAACLYFSIHEVALATGGGAEGKLPPGAAGKWVQKHSHPKSNEHTKESVMNERKSSLSQQTSAIFVANFLGISCCTFKPRAHPPPQQIRGGALNESNMNCALTLF